MRSYEYRCKDYSYLSPTFKQLIVKPLLEILPYSLSPNIITIISNCFFYLAFYLTINKDLLGKTNFLIIPVLILIYLIGDHLDGAQAERTKTSSALGEFIDHYLDTFNAGILTYIFFSLFNISELWSLGVVLFSTFAALVGVYYEQFKSGWLINGKVGYFELMISCAFLIFLSYFDPVYNLTVSALIADISILKLLLGFISIGAVVKFINIIQRVDHVTYGIWLFVVLLSVTAVFGVLIFNVFQMSIVITLYAGWYAGKLMTAHLVDGVERSAGLFTPLILVVVYLLESLNSENTFVIIISYLLINIFLLVYRNISILKKQGISKNPEDRD